MTNSTRRTTSPRAPHSSVIVIAAALGATLRLLWLYGTNRFTHPIEAGEAANVAWSLAHHGTYADAFFAGQGPTAHLMPTAPLVSAALIDLCRNRPAAAAVVLGIWCLIQIGIVMALAAALFRKLGASPRTIERSLIVVALLPIYISEEMADFQFWENGIAAGLVLANLVLLARLDGNIGAWRQRDQIAIALLSALCFFVNPPAGVAIDCCWAVCILRRQPLRHAAATAGLSAAAAVLTITPWAIRNDAALGSPILLRSDFGLELAVGIYTPHGTEQQRADGFGRRLDALHPYHAGAGRRAMIAAGGEVTYSRALQKRALSWIRAHPAAFTGIALGHYRRFYLPDVWQLHLTEWKGLIGFRTIMMDLCNGLGLVALIVGASLRWRTYGYLLGYVVLAGLPYALVEPVPRYSYIVFPLLAFAAIKLIGEDLPAMVRRARGGPDRPAAAPRAARAPRYRGSARRNR